MGLSEDRRDREELEWDTAVVRWCRVTGWDWQKPDEYRAAAKSLREFRQRLAATREQAKQ